MAIDGSVWVSGGGNILKYTRGVKDNFVVSGLDKAMGNGAVIYTNDETEKLYVLDVAAGRVVVLAKTGEYQSQYVNDVMKGATGLVVDEKAGKLYLLAGSKVYEISK